MTSTANAVAILVLLMAGIGLALSIVLHSCEANSRRDCMRACFTASRTNDTCERSCR